jgi:hypothetical protein
MYHLIKPTQQGKIYMTITAYIYIHNLLEYEKYR